MTNRLPSTGQEISNPGPTATPAGWLSVRLSRILDGIKDGTHGSFDRVPEGVPLLSAKNVKNKGLTVSDAESLISQSDHASITAGGYPARGDVLLTIVGTIGRSCVYEFDFPYAFQRSVCFLRPSPRINSHYLMYATQSKHFQDQLALSTKVSAQPGIYMGDVSACTVFLPPTSCQNKIVEFLDHETAKIDVLIDKQEQLVANLREDRAATITHAVTKGLDPNATLRETGTRWVDAIPENWKLSRFSRHIFINSGQVDPRLDPYRDMILIAPNHVESGTGKLVDTESAKEQGADSGKYRVSAGQVIYSKIRPNLAKVTIAPVDCLCSADMYGLSTDPHEILSEFLLYELLSQPFTDYAIDSSMRVAMPKVNHDSLGAAPIWFPPIEEQCRIVKFLDARCASIDALIGKSIEMIETLREYRSALITNSVTGKIDVREAV